MLQKETSQKAEKSSFQKQGRSDQYSVRMENEEAKRPRREYTYQESPETIRGVIDNLSTLEEKQSGIQDVSSYSNDSSHSKKYSCRSLYSVFQKQIVKKVFEMDYVLLSYQAIGLYTFHLIMLMEFFQMFYYIFFRVPLVNEFLPATGNGTSQAIQTQGVNITQIEMAQTISISNDLGIIIPEVLIDMGTIDPNQVLKFYSFFMFSDFQMYIIESLIPQPFTDSYITFTIMVSAFLIPIAVFSGKLFKLVKNDEIKGGLLTFLIKLLSALFMIFITFLQVPITSIISQGFICNESRLEYYGVPWIICGTSQSQIFMGFTAITLFVYIGFLIIQLQLFTSQEFDSSVPWSEFQRGIPVLKMIIKLIITLDFQFDKGGTNKAYFIFLCALLNSYVVYKRLTDSIYFNWSVQWASLTYDVVNTVCYLVVALHIFSQNFIYVSTLSFILAFAVILAISLIVFQERKRRSILMSSRKVLDKFETPSQCETYLFYLHELIQSEEMGDHFLLQGIIATHLDNCEEGFMCQCQDIAQELDQVQPEVQEVQQAIREDNLEESKSATNYGNNSHLKIQEELQDMEVENSQLGQASSKALFYVKDSETKKSNGSQLDISSPKHDGKMEIDEEYPFTLGDLEKRRKIYYRFLFMSIQHAISRFPRNIDLLILNSSLVKSKMNNHIKAIYELLTCESYSPSLHQNFIIFQRKIAVQQELTKLQNSSNKQNASGLLDSQAIVNYERCIQRFHLNEYLATNAAISFWKELLQKNINSSMLQESGLEISRCYQNIQDASAEVQKMHTDDMRFLFRYGLFLIKIVNNEFEGLECFRKVQLMYANRIQRRGRQGYNDQFSFGSGNSETAIVIISATAESVGEIVYANEEIEQMLGYTRSSIISKNVSILMPSAVGRYHNSLIQNFLDRGESKMLDKHRTFFARTSQSYMQPIDVILKIYPNVSDRILIIGFMKQSEQSHDFGNSSHLKDLEHHYIMTDSNGSISSITEGLQSEIGLHPMFFHITSENNFNTMISFEQICPMIYDPDNQYQLQSDEGTILSIDTTNILQLVELEKLSLEEIQIIRTNIGQYQALIQMKRLIQSNTDICSIFIYRILILTDADLAVSQHPSTINIGQVMSDSKKESLHKASIEAKSEEEDASFDSVSSVTSTNSLGSIKNVIKNFKQTLGEKKKPRNIKCLNWMIIGILLLMLLLSSICYVLLSSSINQTNHNIQLSLNAQFRTILEIQVASNIRSYIDIGSELEYDMYDVRRLNNQVENRFNILGRLIQDQASALQAVHEYITQQRSGVDQSISGYEFEPINLIRLDDLSLTSIYQQPYRVSMFDFLNDISGINALTKEQLNMPIKLIVAEPVGPEYFATRYPETSADLQLAYFLMVNGLRDLRTFTASAQNFIAADTISNNQSIIVIMIAAIIITAFALALIHYQIWQIERIQGEVLSLYPHLSLDQINEVYFTCIDYLSAVKEGSLLFQVNHGEANIEHDQVNIGGTNHIKMFHSSNEDAKDEQEYHDNNRQNKSDLRRQRAKQNRMQGMSATIQILKSIKQEIKSLNEKESKPHNKPEIEETKEAQVGNDKLRQRNDLINKKILKKMGVSDKKQERVVIQENESHNNEQESVSESASSQRSLNEKHIKREKKKKQSKHQTAKFEDEPTYTQTEDELTIRKKRFQDTLKTQSLGIKIASIIMNLLICAYFVEVYFQQSFWSNQLVQLNGGVPLVLNRFRYSMLSYAMLRERVMYNNSLDSFLIEDFSYGHNIDQMYNDLSIENEQLILEMKQNHPSILGSLVDFLNVQDSPSLCSQIIGQSVTNISATNLTIRIGQASGPGQPDQDQIDTTIKACLAAFQGDIGTLKSLSIDFNAGDYDGRTPLQLAVRGNQLAAVQYLLGLGVSTNTTDRWGATPMNYADQYPQIEALLIQAGGIRGINQPLLSGSMTQMFDDQWRMYYAAYNNDIATIQLLYYLGWTADLQDLDGRSPLHIAACQGSMDVVSFLVLRQKNFLLVDFRGNDAESDAVRESQTAVANYLDGVVSSYLFIQDCSHFAGGIFQQGIHSAIGTFHVQFADLQLHINSTDSAETRMSMLTGSQIIGNTSTNQTFNQTIMQTYFNAQEIYFSTILNVTMQMISDTYGNSIASQQSITQIVFLVFLTVQLVTLFVLRKRMIARMIDDVFKSRGILNLIPNHVIEENKTAAEAIMNKLKV